MTNWRSLAVPAAIVSSLFIGWHLCTIYNGYKSNVVAEKQVITLGKTISNVVAFNQKIEKEKANVKDKCASAAIPPTVLQLLK